MTEMLFNQPQDKIVTAYDLYGKNHQRNIKNFKFRASAYGLLVENGKILLNRHPAITQFGLPGGGIEMHETIHEGLIREFKEETGLTVKPDKLVLVEDGFFTTLTEDAHGILIFYTVKKIKGRLTPNNEDSAEIKYFDLATLKLDLVFMSCHGAVAAAKQLFSGR